MSASSYYCRPKSVIYVFQKSESWDYVVYAVPTVALYTHVDKLGTSNFGGSPPSWIFKNSNFLKSDKVNRRMAINGHALPCQIASRPVEALPRYGDLSTFFAKRRPAAIMDLSDAYWDHPRRVGLLDGLYRCAKFGWNRSVR